MDIFKNFKRPFDFFHNLVWSGKLVWEAHPGYTLLTAVLIIIQGSLPATQLWISKLLIDSVVDVFSKTPENFWQQKDWVNVLGLILMNAATLLIGVLISTTLETVRPLLGELLCNLLSTRILDKTNQLDITFFEDEKFYNKLQNAYAEVNHRPLEIVFQMFLVAQTVITTSTMVLLLTRLHWVVLSVIIFTTLPLLIVQGQYGFKNYWMLRDRSPEERKKNYYGMLLTSDWFIKEIRIFNLEAYFLNLYKSIFGKFYTENKRLLIKYYTKHTVFSVISILGWIIAMFYIVLRLVSQSISVGDFMLYNQAIFATQNQIKLMLLGISSLYTDSLFLNNLRDFLNLRLHSPSSQKPWTEPIEEIEFQDVSFSYPKNDNQVLDKINFKIKHRQALALVGKNGAGKTTLVKLLCQLYKPTSGRILINGKNAAEYDPRSIQDHISVLFQDYGHYYLTARENIRVGRNNTRSISGLVEVAAKKSGVNHLVEALPNRYETMLGKWFEDGTELSGGEWQKIALARAFFREGEIMILDEPTASLDVEAELNVFKELTQSAGNQITLIISHRFSTVRMANVILVLEGGKCVESGSHKELMAMEGKYAYLYKLQASGYQPYTVDDDKEIF